jgi:hypothetical protein
MNTVAMLIAYTDGEIVRSIRITDAGLLGDLIDDAEPNANKI